MDTVFRIGTHDGRFHADDVLGTAICTMAVEGDCGVEYIRSRNVYELERADIILDVGGRNDGVKWFDHHTKQEFRDNGIPIASAGQMWRHFYKTIIAKRCAFLNANTLTEQNYTYIYSKIDNRIVSNIDAIDCGNATINDSFSLMISAFNFDRKNTTYTNNHVFEEIVNITITLFRNVIDREILTIETNNTLIPDRYEDGDIVYVATELSLHTLQSKLNGAKLIVAYNNTTTLTRIICNILDMNKKCIYKAPLIWRGYDKRNSVYSKYSIFPTIGNLQIRKIAENGLSGVVKGTKEEAVEFAKIWLRISKEEFDL